jgi:protein gp37
MGCPESRQLDWVINGGESAHLMPPRKYFVAWARLLIQQCRALDVPFFLKQLGSLAFDGERRVYTKHPAGADADEWPADLRVQQWSRLCENEERPVSQPTLL